MKRVSIEFLVGLMMGTFFGMMLEGIGILISAKQSAGTGLHCANKILNNPDVVIDTTIIIHQQDTTATYKFVKNDTTD